MNKHTIGAVVVALVTAGATGQDQARDDVTVEAVLSRAVEAYAALDAYADELDMEYDVEMADGAGFNPFAAMGDAMSGSLLFQRPDRIALRSPMFDVYCDGTRLWIVSSQMGQYLERDAPERIDLSEYAPALGTGSSSPHIVLDLLLAPGRPFFEVLPDLGPLDTVIAEARDGVPGHRVSGRMAMPAMAAAGSVPISLWFSGETGLLGEMRVELTEMFNQMSRHMPGFGTDDDRDGDEGQIRRAEVVVSMQEIRVDPDLAESSFVYEPAAGLRKVDAFDFAAGAGYAPAQTALIGEPAPPLEARDLEGEALTLEALRGRVVVLDFWATWCGPCVMAIPHVQKIADRFADRPVTVLGVNRDFPGQEAQVRRFLEDKKITFRQAMDPEGAIAAAYSVTGIPCTVLIDQAGVVQDVHVGFMPGQEKSIGDDVERLLGGESLAAERRAARAQPVQPGVAANVEPVELDPIDPDRFVDDGALPGQYSGGHVARAIDLDGDGRDELVTGSVGWRSGISIVSADGNDARHLELEGLGMSAIGAIEVVRQEGRMRWLVGTTGMGGQGQLGLYDDEGGKLWTWSPEVPAGTMAHLLPAAGDLDGDGKAEFAVGIMAYSMQGGASVQSFSAWLAVLDDDGTPLALRKVGQMLERVWITDPAAGAPRILFVGDGRLRRFAIE